MLGNSLLPSRQPSIPWMINDPLTSVHSWTVVPRVATLMRASHKQRLSTSNPYLVQSLSTMQMALRMKVAQFVMLSISVSKLMIMMRSFPLLSRKLGSQTSSLVLNGFGSIIPQLTGGWAPYLSIDAPLPAHIIPLILTLEMANAP